MSHGGRARVHKPRGPWEHPRRGQRGGWKCSPGSDGRWGKSKKRLRMEGSLLAMEWALLAFPRAHRMGSRLKFLETGPEGKSMRKQVVPSWVGW